MIFSGIIILNIQVLNSPVMVHISMVRLMGVLCILLELCSSEIHYHFFLKKKKPLKQNIFRYSFLNVGTHVTARGFTKLI